jgi:uncharacterized protein YbjT (DUF2867 family)
VDVTFVVTGATGNIGSRVVDRLLARGARPRVFVRDAAKAHARFGGRVDVVIGDLADSASLEAAFEGAGVIFLVNSGPGLEHRDALAARAARAAGVERIVKLSSMDAAQQVGTGVWHARGEDAIGASGVELVSVRPSGFMDNALYWAHSIRAEGVVRSSTADGKIAFVHSDDIADVAAFALTSSRRPNVPLALSGPRALSYPEMTASIATRIGRTIRYEWISDEAQDRRHEAMGEPPAMVEAHASIYRAIRDGRLADVTSTVEQVLGRPAYDFEAWVEQNASAFAPCAPVSLAP